MRTFIKTEKNGFKENGNNVVDSKKRCKKDLVQVFRDLFSGREDCWGKIEGRCVRGELNDSHYKKHLEGLESLGIYPVLDDGTCNFAVIDFDFKSDKDREGKARASSKEFVQRLKAKGVEQCWVEISKSNLRHVCIFFEEPVAAKDVRSLFKHILEEMGLPIRNGCVEIFPKQDSLEEGMVGNYINLPYFGVLVGSQDTRIMFDMDTGEIISLEDFIEQASTNRVSSEQLEKALEGLPSSVDVEETKYIKVPTARLSAHQEKMIIENLVPYWNEGSRQDLTMYISGYLAKQGIDREDTMNLISVITGLCGDGDIKERHTCVKATYDGYRRNCQAP